MGFRKLDSFIPGADEADIFGQHAVKLMRRTLEIGYEAAIREEADNPTSTWDDPDWCRMIAARLGGQVPTFDEDTSVTFRCHKCRDTGFIHLEPIQRFGSTYQVARVCDPCHWRLWNKAQWLKQQEREGPSKRGRLRGGLAGDSD